MSPRRAGSLSAFVTAAGMLVILLSSSALQSPRLAALVIGAAVVVVGCTGAIVSALHELAAGLRGEERRAAGPVSGAGD